MSVAPGQNAQITPEQARRHRAIVQLNDLRMSPVKQLPMTVIFLWMSGNEVSIFTIMFLGMALLSPFTALAAVNSTFERFVDDARKDKHIASALSQAKLIYILCCLAGLAVALTKLQWMGLLPVCMMDWMSTMPLPLKERSFGFVSQ